jgi:hypothetical protein
MRPLPLALGLIACLCLIPTHARAQQAKLQSTADGDVVTSRRPAALLRDAQKDLFEGRYGDAASSFGAVASGRKAGPNDTLAAWAYHGVALARALAGDRSGARAEYDLMLRVAPESPLAIADSIEAAVLTDRRDLARALLDRFASTRLGILPQQYAHSFRALSYMIAGQCTAAVAELRRAPDPGRPLPQAIRARCAAVSGRHAEAIALRDSVLTHPLANPDSWPMIIARGVARKIR